MALVQPTLNNQLKDAFSAAMEEFLTVSSQPEGNEGQDVSQQAIIAASETFASIATPAIDAYIKSATITIPPGQVVVTSGSPTTQTGATTTTSSPANIV